MRPPTPIFLLVTLLLIDACSSAQTPVSSSSPNPPLPKTPSLKKTTPSPSTVSSTTSTTLGSSSSTASLTPSSTASISSSSSSSPTPSTTTTTTSTTTASRNVSIEPRVKSTTSGGSLYTSTTKRVGSSSASTQSSSRESSSTPSTTSAKETRESPGKIRPQIKLTTNYTSASETGVRLPEGASAALAKPTKYHYYPHNQHIYLLPECAVQQVCNAVYVRLNFTQPLCACPGRYRDPCSASLDSDDLHTTELVTDSRTKALTLVKTCEPVAEMRECRAPRDWSLLALQNVRTGKSHYLVICRCPDTNILEGPMSHDQPTYASVPGIRVYGMMCVQGSRRGRPLRNIRSILGLPSRVEETSNDAFPWHLVPELMRTAKWD
ncbi:mucin-5AC [Nasonia vitripennis]|uniref:Uncharacterized protein n=1 Tax=Nasonia vitripennis TaxID=7425 RepID=A0A7M7IMZ6_NASVI|nr:mucin-5AC [Nasonia vitripennis]XP_016837966.1 mucin-5AC [Nasonia vitripennis]XP_016837967.1 mucin-5AC [Nasonia vitripennis]XP_016837968.1 mucin-5AC [Nasonia vitripennis]